ncbi:MAG: hypothetical protein NVSMB9_28400 [Isosphaeraceae bacterium]
MSVKPLQSFLGFGIAAWGIVSATPVEAADRSEVARRIETLKLPESQRKWQQIPWITDLAEGLRLARTEQRPIFLWVTGDDPLERC